MDQGDTTMLCSHDDTDRNDISNDFAADTDQPVPTDGTHQYAIPEANIHDLRAKLADLNKRAKRLKVAPVELKEIRTETRVERKRDTHGRPLVVTRLYYIVEITGETPRLNGWTFIATLDHSTAQADDGKPVGVIVRTIPGETLPVEYRDYNPTCEHCNKKRIRNETFVLKNQDGRLVRVGRQCLKDFLGHDNPHAVARMAEWLASIDSLARSAEDEGFGGFGGGQGLDYLPDYLGFVAAEMRTNGWVSGREAREFDKSSTASMAANNMSNLRNRYFSGDRSKIPQATDADKQQVEAAVEWIREVRNSDADLNDYMSNLSIVCASDTLHPKNRGIAASLLPAHLRHLEREVNRKAALNLRATSTFQGTVSKRQEWILTLLGWNVVQTIYGSSCIVRLTDGTNAFTWFASSDFDMEPGQTYRVKATVRKHETYRHKDADPAEAGTKTTYINRLTVIAKVDKPA